VLILTLEISLEVLVGENKSETDESIPTWLAGLGSETPEQVLAFHNWLQSSPNDKHMEIVKQSWLPDHSG
jgi:hypothetical protein